MSSNFVNGYTFIVFVYDAQKGDRSAFSPPQQRTSYNAG